MEFDQWFEKMIDAHDGITWIKNIYWRLDVYSCVLVLRDKEWFKNAVVKIEALWKIVETEKVTGHDHRAPKRRVVKRNDKKGELQIQTKIVLNDDGSFVPVSSQSAGNSHDQNTCHSGLFL